MLAELPIELVRDILELAARSCIPNQLAQSARLMLVCRAAYTWILPIQYETLWIDERSQAAIFDLVEEKPPTFFAMVQHLMLLWALPHGGIQDKFLASFQHVASVTTHGRGLRFLLRAPALSPTRLFLISAPGFDVWSSHAPALRRVTHLRIMFDVEWPELAIAMPSLSHVCLDRDANKHIHDAAFVQLKSTVQAILRLPHCARVLVRFSVLTTAVWSAMVAALRALGDARVYVYRTTRADLPWMRAQARELQAGIDSWTDVGHAAHGPRVPV